MTDGTGLQVCKLQAARQGHYEYWHWQQQYVTYWHMKLCTPAHCTSAPAPTPASTWLAAWLLAAVSTEQ